MERINIAKHQQTACCNANSLAMTTPTVANRLGVLVNKDVPTVNSKVCKISYKETEVLKNSSVDKSGSFSDSVGI